MPSRRAVAFISTEKASIDPETPSASTTAMSLDERTIIIFSALSTVTSVPTGKPILTGCWAAAAVETLIAVSSAMRPSRMARSVT